MLALVLAAQLAAASAPLTPAEQARQALDHEAARMMEGAYDIPERYKRPWHELWRLNGEGAVGRLHDYCTGAVEPAPKLTVGPWTWDTLDPRALSPADRETVKVWRFQEIAAGFACGTIFSIGDTGADARKPFQQCDVDPARAFTAHVTANPQLRTREDYTEVTTEALRAAGCR